MVDFGRIPCAHDQTTALRIRFDLRDNLVDLIDAHAIGASPISPLCAVYPPQISFFVGPLVPNRDTVIVQVFDVGFAPQKPKQLVNDGFEMQLFGGEQGERLPQIEARLRPEDRDCAYACPIPSRLPAFQNKPKEVVVLAHAKTYRDHLCAKTKKSSRYSLAGRAKLFLQLLPPFVQSLQTQLPPVQLDTELIDVTRDFGSLRFVFLELSSQVRNLGLCFGR